MSATSWFRPLRIEEHSQVHFHQATARHKPRHSQHRNICSMQGSLQINTFSLQAASVSHLSPESFYPCWNKAVICDWVNPHKDINHLATAIARDLNLIFALTLLPFGEELLLFICRRSNQSGEMKLKSTLKV